MTLNHSPPEADQLPAADPQSIPLAARHLLSLVPALREKYG
jgi:hypothetical protein